MQNAKTNKKNVIHIVYIICHNDDYREEEKSNWIKWNQMKIAMQTKCGVKNIRIEIWWIFEQKKKERKRLVTNRHTILLDYHQIECISSNYKWHASKDFHIFCPASTLNKHTHTYNKQ